jgi:predicted dehydrogenase
MNNKFVEDSSASRRDLLRIAGASFTSSVLTGSAKGANDRITCAVIGVGRMGSYNLGFALRQPEVEVVAVCDVYSPHLENAVRIASNAGKQVKAVRDFREIIEDKSIDIVCISTPDHWHAYMTVEGCKHGKDVYVEKPLCTCVEEGQKMLEAARKYNRVVQAGTMQRSGIHFQKAVEVVKSGVLGDITTCRTWVNGVSEKKGIGNPPEGEEVPPGLDWDMWLGPAPKRPFNANRWGVHPEIVTKRKPYPYFRYFWDYAGGMMTDWGVHLIDIVHMAFDEPMPRAITALGGKWVVTDNRETPDTLIVTYEYAKPFVCTFESLSGASLGSPFGEGPGTLFQGTKGSLYVNRSYYKIFPEPGSGLEAGDPVKLSNDMSMSHWANFIECVKTRRRPVSDIETCYKTTAACLLGNISYRSKLRLDWDTKRQTLAQREACPYLKFDYRKPWKLVV